MNNKVDKYICVNNKMGELEVELVIGEIYHSNSHIGDISYEQNLLLVIINNLPRYYPLSFFAPIEQYRNSIIDEIMK